MKVFSSSSAVLLAAFGLVRAAPRAHLKRQITQLRDAYDFVIIGGGTAGLTVGDRISEAFNDSESGQCKVGRC